MTSGVKYTEEEKDTLKRQIIDYLNDSVGGTYSGACKSVGLARNMSYIWRNQDPDFERDVMEARRNSMSSGLDLAEGKLISAINEGDMTGIIFFLKTQGKERGYIEKSIQDQNVSGVINSSLTVSFVKAERQNDA